MPDPASTSDPGAVLVDVLLESYALHPDAIADTVAAAAARVGGARTELWMVDLDQRSLCRLLADGEETTLALDDSLRSRAYTEVRALTEELPDGRRQLWLPLLDSADRLGVMGVVVEQLARPPLRWWMALASFTGEMLAAKAPYGDALVRARRSAEPSLAAEMRWAMLPPLTFVSPALTINGILEPAYEIAGDTFDYAVNGSVAHFALLDAMGHGLEASRMANLAVCSYRQSRRAGLTVPEMVTAMDEGIAAEFGEHRFVTGQLGTLDLDAGRLRFVNMGHPLPLRFRDGRFVGPVECSPCLPLGLGSVPATQASAELEPGEILLFHTDGVTEARSPDGEMFGEGRLADLVAGLLGGGVRPSEVLRQVVGEVAAHQGDSMADDATLMLVGWRLPVRAPV